MVWRPTLLLLLLPQVLLLQLLLMLLLLLSIPAASLTVTKGYISHPSTGTAVSFELGGPQVSWHSKNTTGAPKGSGGVSAGGAPIGGAQGASAV